MNEFGLFLSTWLNRQLCDSNLGAASSELSATPIVSRQPPTKMLDWLSLVLPEAVKWKQEKARR